ncbi:hypothetical protein AVEN_47332-1 [Araneus ventricosus]|uniref:Uncharacterized protein n=1 Tax=Araneus ventricosus TaxID=182803 RepID=A0A4Y2F9Q4_ARAVE|nr:hypothetical protein AVEN_47332-1 [Araneus ventricosus]
MYGQRRILPLLCEAVSIASSWRRANIFLSETISVTSATIKHYLEVGDTIFVASNFRTHKLRHVNSKLFLQDSAPKYSKYPASHKIPNEQLTSERTPELLVWPGLPSQRRK